MKKTSLKYLSVIILLLAIAACSETIENDPEANMSPDTHIFINSEEPDSLNKQKSVITIHWWGDDPDGLIAGYYFRWKEINPSWSFSNANDSTFSLPLGSSDAVFTFEIFAVDNNGNNRYDASITRNGYNLGAEPFVDANGNSQYDAGEVYYDIGEADATPASQMFPIQNTPPEVEWNDISVLPATSLPVISVGWLVSDPEGIETVTSIQLAINDTNQFISLTSDITFITMRVTNPREDNPVVEFVLEGDENRIHDETLSTLKYNSNNYIYLRAEDISNGKSDYITLPDTASGENNWYVQQPKGNVLLVDDYGGGGTEIEFYKDKLNSVNSGSFNNKYDVLDLEAVNVPYESFTKLNMLDLYDNIIWYSDGAPDLALLTSFVPSFIDPNRDGGAGNIALMLQFADSSGTFDFSLNRVQSFLPIDSLGEDEPYLLLRSGASVLPTANAQASGYQNMSTSENIANFRTYGPTTQSRIIYNVSGKDRFNATVEGPIAFFNQEGTLFFMGMPLHFVQGNNNTEQLLKKVLVDEFGADK